MFEAKEAFCLMTYQCNKCGKTEEIYNSRDGVTPFGIGCRFCDGIASHVNWQYDLQDPNFTPPPGMRVFADYTPERAKKAAIRHLARFKGTAYELTEGVPAYNEMIRKLTEQIVNDCCSVDILITDAERTSK